MADIHMHPEKHADFVVDDNYTKGKEYSNKECSEIKVDEKY